MNLFQWFKNGDHPEDYVGDVEGIVEGIDGEKTLIFSAQYRKEKDWEGDVVRRYRNPYNPGNGVCEVCGKIFHIHGWIDQGKDGITVCPGDWIGKNWNLYFVIKDSEKKKLEFLDGLK